MTDIDQRTIAYGNVQIRFNVVFSARSTLAIEVHPNAEIIVRAPNATDLPEIDKRVHKRARWICQQLAFFEPYSLKLPPPTYISGATHLYLGRQYRLKTQVSANNLVAIDGKQIMVAHKPNSSPQAILAQWYKQQATAIFNELFMACLKKFRRFNLGQPTLKIAKMQKRWGSLSSRDTITLNPKLILADKTCIEYVIIHELCHLRYRSHDQKFYNLLNQKMPHWRQAKQRLELLLN